MVTKTPKEIDEMRWLISIGQLPPDAIEQHYEQEYQQTFGQDYKVDSEGNPIERSGQQSAALPQLDRCLHQKPNRAAPRRPREGIHRNPRAHGS